MSLETNAHYLDVNTGWPATMPSCTREEADRASRAIIKHFGIPWMRNGVRGECRVRRCWIAVSEPYGTLHRGWRRLAHDWSHRIFSWRNRQHRATAKRRPHDPAHVHVEREVMHFIIQRGFLDGRLKPAPKAKLKPAPVDKLAKIEAATKRWTTKLRRAETALRKLKRRAAYYARRAALPSPAHLPQ